MINRCSRCGKDFESEGHLNGFWLTECYECNYNKFRTREVRMSAWIVSNKVISCIIDLIKDYKLQEDLEKIDKDFDNNYDEDKFGQDLLNMNYDAVNQRYNSEEQATEFKYNRVMTLSNLAKLKQFDCFMYQCSGGNVPCDELFCCLDIVRDKLRSHIIHDLPEYKKAKWGID